AKALACSAGDGSAALFYRELCTSMGMPATASEQRKGDANELQGTQSVALATAKPKVWLSGFEATLEDQIAGLCSKCPGHPPYCQSGTCDLAVASKSSSHVRLISGTGITG